MSTGRRICGSISTVAAVLVLGTGAAASAATSPGYKPVPGLTKVPATAGTLPLVSIGTGKDPNLLVDKAGTAHIVYTEDGGSSSADTLAVCNLQRGHKSCAQNSTAPTPQAPTGGANDPFTGNSPGLNHDFDGAIPLDVENQLYVIERRFPDVFSTPDGQTSDSNVFEWQSTDGGNTLTGPAQIGDNQIAGGAVLYGDPSAPSIGTISRTETAGTFFQGTAPGSYSGTSEAQLGDGDHAYDGSVAADMSGSMIRPVAAYADLNGNTYIREWSGQGNVNDPSTWSAPTVVKGNSPQLIGGPTGVYLLTSSSNINGGVESLQKVVNTTLSGPVVKLPTSASPPAISEDATGAISYAFTNATGVEVETSTTGASFTPAQLVAAIPSGQSIGHLVTAATSDAGGFVTFVKNPQGAEGIGTIMAGAFGTQASTQAPGLGPLPGGGIGSAAGDQEATSTCSSAKFGDVDAEISPRGSACFVPDPSDPNMSVTLGTVDLNGLLLIPDKGTRIGIDPKLHKIQTSGSVSVVLRANGIPDITLYHGPLGFDVPDDGDNGDLFSPYFNGTGINVAGFPIDGSIDVKLAKGGVNIPISLKLPDYLGGVTGAVTLHAASFQGLSIDSLNFSIPDIDLAAIEIKDLTVSYQSAGDVWAGSAQIFLPSGGSAFQLKLSVEFDNGQWTKGHLDVGVPYPGIPLGDEDPPDLYFTHGYVDLNFLHGVTLTGGVGFGAIPLPLSEDPGPQDFLFSVDASLIASFKNPVTLSLKGITYLSKIQIGQEVLTWQLPDNISFAGQAGINLGPVNVNGEIGGQIEPSHHLYGAYYDATGNILNFVKIHVGIAVDQDGFGAELPVGGIECYWDPSKGCSPTLFADAVKPFKNPPLATGAIARRAHTTALASFTVPAGAPSVTVDVTGLAGPPDVVLINPSGQQVTPTMLTQDAIPAGATAIGVTDTADGATDLGLKQPQAGTWQVMQAPNSPSPVAGVKYAVGVTAPTATATVSGTGHTRVLHYHVTTAENTGVTFVEETSRLQHVIGTAKGTSGTIAFTPLTGPAGKRKIVAEITNGGLAIKDTKVATYSAPGPLKPSRASSLKVKAAKTSFSYSYTPPANATKVLVTLLTTDGRHVQHLVSARSHRGSLPARGLTDGLTVTVVGIGASGARGPSASAHASRTLAFPKKK